VQGTPSDRTQETGPPARSRVYSCPIDILREKRASLALFLISIDNRWHGSCLLLFIQYESAIPSLARESILDSFCLLYSTVYQLTIGGMVYACMNSEGIH
jgi:hypothetical protein